MPTKARWKAPCGFAPALVLLFAGILSSQTKPAAPPQTDAPTLAATDAPERWNWFFQATSIGDMHGSFPALSSGPLSLVNHPEHDVSLTATLFFAYRPFSNTFSISIRRSLTAAVSAA